jgi:hypothetical protein
MQSVSPVFREQYGGCEGRVAYLSVLATVSRLPIVNQSLLFPRHSS